MRKWVKIGRWTFDEDSVVAVLVDVQVPGSHSGAMTPRIHLSNGTVIALEESDEDAFHAWYATWTVTDLDQVP